MALVDDEGFCARLQGEAADLARAGEECLLPIAQRAGELIGERMDEVKSQAVAACLDGEAAAHYDEADAEEDAALAASLSVASVKRAGPRRLGRRSMYSHHIIASSKRQVIGQWASQLRLGCLAKIGWPGLIVVEGDEQDVQAYVEALSRLRWKHFVVRGEQILEAPEGQGVDDLRAMPIGFEEFGTEGMSEFATRCRQYGLEELFLISLKLSGVGAVRSSGGKSNAAETSAQSSASRRGNKR
eukprot:TRINITY_DN17606_c0_g1_i1.p1 TRINITY_DN17606_c0_g1~~TRINITY_DN17606_c0_g1_i1.p1  ORF type:complete len:243 (+),score=54.87 TRINITY_DN17606_c0_g1_i1:626-1354(+)